MKGTLWTIAVVIILAAVLLPAGAVGYSESAQTITVEAESIDLSTNEWTTVEHADESSRVYSVVVRHNDIELEPDEEYEWRESGELRALDAQYDGETVEVDYQYDRHTDISRSVAAIAAVFDPVWAGLVLIATVATLVGWASVLGDSFGGR